MASAATVLSPDSVYAGVGAQFPDAEPRTLDLRGKEALVAVRALRNPHQ